MLSNWANVIGWCFFSLSFFLFLSVYFLIRRLRKKRDQISTSQNDEESFNREIRALIAILIIFSSTYMLRGAHDQMVIVDAGEFVATLEGLVIILICDFAPLMVLLVFHFKNFT